MSCNSNSKMYFFRGSDQDFIKDNLCQLGDASLTKVFTNVSATINYQAVRNLVMNFLYDIFNH